MVAIDWKPIPAEEDRTRPPFDGNDVLLYADSATVDVVRLSYWGAGGTVDYDTGDIIEPRPEDRGWWSAKHSVTSEHISGAPGCNWTHWAPFNEPLDVAEQRRRDYGR